MVRGVASALGIVLITVTGACSGPAGRSQPSTEPPVDRQLMMLESNTAAAHVSERAGRLETPGGVISVKLQSSHRDFIHVSDVEPVADVGLRVTYLGFASCKKGCAGAMDWTDEARQTALGGLEGVYPIELRPDQALSLVFRLEVTGEDAIRTLRDRCVLRIHDLVLTLDGEKRVRVTPIGGVSIGGLSIFPEVGSECEAIRQ